MARLMGPVVCNSRAADDDSRRRNQPSKQYRHRLGPKPARRRTDQRIAQHGRHQGGTDSPNNGAPNVTHILVWRTAISEMVQNVTYFEPRQLLQFCGPKRGAPNVTHIVICGTRAFKRIPLRMQQVLKIYQMPKLQNNN